MNILALDLATKTGWAHSGGGSGVQDFAPRRGDSPGMRWVEFQAWLRRILDSCPTDVIAYEQAHHRGGAATHVAHSLIGIVEKVAAERKIELTNRHSKTIKKYATGNGNASKEKMMEAGRKAFCQDFIDDNECDACWLLELVVEDLK